MNPTSGLPLPGSEFAGENAVAPAPLVGPARSDEARQFPRLDFRTRVEATIHPLSAKSQAFPQPCVMLSRDLSRGGINLLHSEPLSPGQKIEIALHDGRRWVEVMWCRRLTNGCFSIGCKFVGTDDEADRAP